MGRLENVKCSPEGEHLRFPLFFTGGCTWENQIRRHRNRQNLCDWILGRVGNDVKEKTSYASSTFKPITRNGLVGVIDSGRLWKRRFTTAKFHTDSGLTRRNPEAYLSPRTLSSRSRIMAPASSVRPSLRARIRTAANPIPAIRHRASSIPHSTKMFRIRLARPFAGFTGTFSFHVRFSLYLTCARTRSAASGSGGAAIRAPLGRVPGIFLLRGGFLFVFACPRAPSGGAGTGRAANPGPAKGVLAQVK